MRCRSQICSWPPPRPLLTLRDLPQMSGLRTSLDTICLEGRRPCYSGLFPAPTRRRARDEAEESRAPEPATDLIDRELAFPIEEGLRDWPEGRRGILSVLDGRPLGSSIVPAVHSLVWNAR